MDKTNELTRHSQYPREGCAQPMVDPLFILAPPRSFTSVVAAMLGQHPQMYSLPELHLFSFETMAERWARCQHATYPMAHGLLRAVAQLYFGEQTEHTVRLARGWLRRRLHFTTGYLFEMLAAKVHPLRLVDKSPRLVYRMTSLQRLYSMFPHAQFLHLLRHPRGHGESVMKLLDETAKHGPIPPSHWLLSVASYPRHSQDSDPQRGWYAAHMNICEFLQSVPAAQQMQVRGEDVLTDPDPSLHCIAEWLGLRTDTEALEAMKHPERSPYAGFGPPGARYGNDPFFLSNPALRTVHAASQSLEGPLSWRDDGREFLPRVKRLAQQFGYQ